MPRPRRTIFFGSGQGLVTASFMGNSGCIHPIEGGGMKKKETDLLRALQHSNSTLLANMQLEMNALKKEIRVLHIDVNLLRPQDLGDMALMQGAMEAKMHVLYYMVRRNRPWYIKVWDFLRGKK